MIVDNDLRLQRIDDCRELYLKHEGQHHELIESEMRALGHGDFHRRSLYDRFERGKHKAGWIGRFGFNALVRRVKEKADHEAQIASMRERMGFDVDETADYTAETQRRGEGEGEKRRKGDGELVDSANASPILPISPSHHLLFSLPQRLSDSAVKMPGDTLPDFTEFLAWLKQVSPTMEWEWKHQVYIYKRLRRVSEGLCKRLMIFLPPRHGKSELVTVRYSAWRLKQDPTLNIILGSYNQRLANRFSRKIRRVLTDDAHFTAETQRRGESEAGTKRLTGPANLTDKGTGSHSSSQRLSVSAVKNPASDFPSRIAVQTPRPNGKLPMAAD